MMQTNTQEIHARTRAAVMEAEAAVNEAIRAQLRGTATQADVAKAKAAYDAAVLYAANARLHASEQAHRASSGGFTDAAEQDMRNDAKLRGELLTIYANYSAKKGAFANWGLMLTDIFPPPTDAEIKHVVALSEARLYRPPASGRVPR